jgi:excisionase family DNA binding protein
VELIKRSEAAEMLGVSEDTVKKLVASGHLPCYRITPKIIRFDRQDVLDYLQSRRTRMQEVKRTYSTRVLKPEPYRGGVNNSGYYPGMKVVGK